MWWPTGCASCCIVCSHHWKSIASNIARNAASCVSILPDGKPRHELRKSRQSWCVGISETLNRIYGVRNFVTPLTMFVGFCSLRCNQTKQTEYAPYFRPKWQNLYPTSDKKCLKMIPFGAAHTYMAYIWVEYPYGRKAFWWHVCADHRTQMWSQEYVRPRLKAEFPWQS